MKTSRFFDGGAFGPKDHALPIREYGKLPAHLGGAHDLHHIYDGIGIITSQPSSVSNGFVLGWRMVKARLTTRLVDLRIAIKKQSLNEPSILFKPRSANCPASAARVKIIRSEEPYQLG